MANYASLKSTIDAVIRANGGLDPITGPVLNGVLTNILAEMGQAGYLFKGMAHPGDTPAASDSNLFYLAVEAGQYSGFDGRTVTAGQLVIFAWDGAWASDVLLDISGKANKNGDPAEAFAVFTLTAISNIVGAAVTGETVGADKVILHNPDNNAMTDLVPGGQSEDIEVAMPSKSGTLALQEDVDAGLEKKANVDGFYGGLTSGAAENLVGRGSVEAEYQGIRTSAGTDDIGVGAAMITKMQGASIVINQFVQNGNFESTSGWTGVGGTIAAANNILTFTAGSNVGTSSRIQQPISTRNGHVYAIRFTVESSVATQIKFGIPGSTAITSDNIGAGEKKELSYVKQPVRDADLFYLYVNGTGTLSEGDTVKFSNVMYLDLTLMFGSTIAAAMTVEQFERMFPLPYYTPNPGTIVNNEATGIKTVGFNLYNHATGKAVLPGKYSSYPLEYEICGAFTSISFEDYAGNVSTPALVDGRFFNVDRPGVLTVTGGNDTDTLVHLVWSGWRNFGEPDYVYEPYWENILHLNLKTITGKLNGAGASVVIFPDGMRSAGSAFDYLIVDADGYARTAVKVVGELDLGDYTWGYNTSNVRFASPIIPAIKAPASAWGDNGICERYQVRLWGSNSDKFVTIGQNQRLYLKDTAFGSDGDALRASLVGVKMLIELATPEVYTLDEPIYMGYPVDDFGTEAKLPVDEATLPTGPVRYEVRYPFNAVDTMRNLPVNYISKESMLAYLTARGPIDNGTWTMTWDAVAGRYDFTFTPNE